jgi:hypothetical protein
MNTDRLSKLMFIFSSTFLILLGIFIFGFSVGHFKITPHKQLIAIKDHIQGFITKGKWKPSGIYVDAPKDSSRTRIAVQQTAMPGYRGIMGFDAETDRYAVWLIDHHGKQHHIWPIDYWMLKEKMGTNEPIINPHGMSVLDDGTLLVNFGKGGELIARLDACGQKLWSRDGIYHHSIDLTEDGSLWTWRADDHIDGHFQYLAKLDIETGTTQREISLIDDILKKSTSNAAIIGVPFRYEFQRFDSRDPKRIEDIFHPNDIEILETDLADQFPLFRPGDLLISLRNLHLIAVIDRSSGIIKWWSNGPWRFQHDPDFGPDGRIYVYNNNSNLIRSNIIAIDPVTKEVNRYFFNDKVDFYSETQGKQTIIPNGMMQITVPDEGRILEATWDGKIVFEFNNLVDQKTNAHVVNSVWLPEDFFSVFPSCGDR